MTRAAPERTARPHSEAAGSTVSVLPTARNTSQAAAACPARANTSGSSGWPNMTVADLRIPPHRVHPGSSSPASIRASAPAIGDRSPQDTHTTLNMVPCSSITRSAGVPAFWCRPSMFCVITEVTTQNIDGLHQKAGTPADRVIELHGTMFSAVCVSCGDRSPMAGALARDDAGEEDPPCARCGGILKSATVMFGQRLDPGVFFRAEQAARRCDLLLAIGSTLTVEPAASLCGVAAGAGAALVIVNADATPYDGLAAEVIREPIGTAVPRIAGQLLGQAG